MAVRGDSWDKVDSVYTETQIENVLRSSGVIVESDTYHDFLCLCPYHGNTDTPSMTVSKTNGKFFCFNPACNEAGAISDLIRFVTGKSHFEVARMIIAAGKEEPLPLKERLAKVLNKEPDFKPFSQETLDKNYDFFWVDDRAQAYMYGRGFTEETLRYFRVGYSAKRDMIIVPMHSPDGVPVGLIGRGIEDKKFKNSKKLPRNLTLWNFHRAKRSGADTLIICESTFDAMRIHQAGYPNVAAVLGGYFSPQHAEQVLRHFRRVLIFTDNDKRIFYEVCNKCRRAGLNLCRGHNAGRELGRSIVQALPGRQILWASYDDRMIYPHDAKDAGDMTDDEIRQCIRNSVSNFEYQRWGLDK